MKYYNDNGEEITELKPIEIGEKQVNLPPELADLVIGLRDTLKQDKNTEIEQLKSQLDEIVKEKALSKSAAEKAEKEKQQLELAKNGELEALKQSIAEEWQEKINGITGERDTLNQRIIDSEVKTAIASYEGVNPQAIDDIFLNLKVGNPAIVDGAVKVGEKDLGDAVKEIIESKDYFRVVKSPVGTGANTTTTTTEAPSNLTGLDRISAGLQK